MDTAETLNPGIHRKRINVEIDEIVNRIVKFLEYSFPFVSPILSFHVSCVSFFLSFPCATKATAAANEQNEALCNVKLMAPRLMP